MMRILGYTVEDWKKIYALHNHEKLIFPRDLWEAKVFWESFYPNTPDGCLKVAEKLAQALDTDEDYEGVASKHCKNLLNEAY
jgi:hypothetical protein